MVVIGGDFEKDINDMWSEKALMLQMKKELDSFVLQELVFDVAVGDPRI